MAQMKKDDEWVIEPVDDEWTVEPIATGPSPTLMSSRQAASKSEFDANQPQSTMLTRARELFLGGMSGLGVDEMHPLKSIGQGAMAVAKGAANPVSQAVDTVRHIGSMAKGLVAGPAEYGQGLQSGDYDAAAHGLGQTIGTWGPILAGGAKAVDSTLAKAKSLRDFGSGGNAAVTAIERNIAPSGTEAKASVLRNAPKLAEKYPDLARVKALDADQRLLQIHNSNAVEVGAVEQSIPRTTKVPQSGITDGLEKIIDKYNELGEPEAAKAVVRDWEKWASKPGQIPWEDFIERKRAFGNQIKTTGGWRETGTAAEKAKAAALREAYGVMMDASSAVSPELQKANQAYSLTHQAIADAGMDFKTGRRIATVGKPLAAGKLKTALTGPFARRVVLGGGLGGAAGAAAYKYFKD